MFILYFIRSLIFFLLFSLHFLTLIFYTVLKKCFLLSENCFLECTKFWAKINVLMLKCVCGANFVVIGRENIPKDNFLALSKHQSTWECYFLHWFLPGYPVSISKKEILALPLFGFAIKNIGTIGVDREDGFGSLREVTEKSKKFVKKGRNIFMMFPQGTRVPPGATPEEYPYRPGFLAIARANALDILPIYLDSGKCWPKGKFIKKPGTITVRILPPLSYESYRDLPKEQIVRMIQNAIESCQEPQS